MKQDSAVSDLIRNGTIYQAVKPEQHPARVVVLVFVILAVLLMIPGIWLLIAGHMEGIILLFTGLILLVFLPNEIKKSRYQNIVKTNRFAKFTEDDFLRLENELYDAPYLYKTFYLLEQYLFIPQVGMLLSYDEIRSVRTVVHKKNLIPQGATVYFLCPDIELDVHIVQWSKYLKETNVFMRRLDEKRLSRLPSKTEQQNELHLPHISM
ncbi:MAG: DUF2892 domain-containing protein [Oscillospiraceae bacterium]|nr:DUF2892 domain-containing protein [Oscillospiraceae bacterium]